MLEYIIIGVLSVTLVLLILYILVDKKNHSDEIENLEENYDIIVDRYEDLIKNYEELNRKYADCIDKHDKAYDDICNRYKLLEMEVEKKDLEIANLNNIKECFNELIKKEDSTDGDKTISIQSGV